MIFGQKNMLKKAIRSKRLWAIFLMLTLTCVLFLFGRLTEQQAGVGFAQQLGSGLSLNSGLGAVVTPDAESVASFIYRRSGTALSNTVKARLASLELQVQQGNRRKIDYIPFSKILTQILLENVDAYSDGDIDYIANHMRSAPYWDTSNDTVTMLRETGGVMLPPNEFSKHTKEFRDQSTAEAMVWRGSSQNRITQEVRDRLQYYSQLNGWAVSLTSGITPSEAILVAYSIVSDDPLVGSDADLRQSMISVHNALSQSHQNDLDFTQRKVSSEAALQVQPPYGTTGYLFCSPLNYFFNENTLLRLLQRIEEETA